ncbi:MAG: ATP-binding protein, partial [Planctomycetota bacterium]
AMDIVYDESALKECVEEAIEVSGEHPILIDKFLDDATELDVDAICDGEIVVIGGIMEHIEEAGVHSGDSACSLPPISLSKKIINEIKRQTKLLAKELKVLGLLNIQYAVKNNDIYILEVNPRASRTIPFVSKAIGVPLAKLAAKVMAGKSLFPGADVILGPEMLSTGEVMGISDDFGMAYAKSQIAAGTDLPMKGTVFISVKDRDRKRAVEVARNLHKMGFKILATRGTCIELIENNIPSEFVRKVIEGRPNIVDAMIDEKVDLIINTTVGEQSIKDSFVIRRTALDRQIPYFTTIRGAAAAAQAIETLQKRQIKVKPIQLYNK